MNRRTGVNTTRARELLRAAVATGLRSLPTPRSPIVVTVKVRRGRPNREEWLQYAAEALRPLLTDVRIDGHPVAFPHRTRISVGFGGDTSRYERKVGGVCFASWAAADRQPQIFMSPTIDDEVTLLRGLLHELIHCADDCVNGHRGWFARVHRAVGFEGKATGAESSAALTLNLAVIAHRLIITHGRYPHAAITFGELP